MGAETPFTTSAWMLGLGLAAVSRRAHWPMTLGAARRGASRPPPPPWKFGRPRASARRRSHGPRKARPERRLRGTAARGCAARYPCGDAEVPATPVEGPPSPAPQASLSTSSATLNCNASATPTWHARVDDVRASGSMSTVTEATKARASLPHVPRASNTNGTRPGPGYRTCSALFFSPGHCQCRPARCIRVGKVHHRHSQTHLAHARWVAAIRWGALARGRRPT